MPIKKKISVKKFKEELLEMRVLLGQMKQSRNSGNWDSLREGIMRDLIKDGKALKEKIESLQITKNGI